MRKLTCLMAATGLALLLAAPLQAQNPTVEWDSHSLIIGGKRVMPVMGEVHYSRIPADEWRDEVRKMKEGGVTIVATYVFWNHIEEQEGVFDWSGQRDLRRFIEICKDEDMPVVLRLGPFCHGEVRNGGMPDWIFTKGCRLREENKVFLGYVERLYRQIFTQVQGLQWKDGGPVVAAQFDNEYRGKGSYLMALKDIALNIGFDLPFYTRTGWPELRTPVPYGEMLPLYGDYADGFWERSTKETAGNYYKAFNFKAFRSSTAIATEALGEQKEQITKGDEQYPYFTCELGGGMTPAYHRRVYLYPEDAYSLAVVKLGSGSNLLGYYMYHGGTNPDGKLTTMNENQRTPGTYNNDLPVKTYDFQAPLGEFGQRNPHYFTLRKLHLFMHDYGDVLATMDAHFPTPQSLEKGDDKSLRWSYRTDGTSGFVFVNNYERLQNLSDKQGVQFDVCGTKFPRKPITIPAGTVCIFPFGINGMDYATAQIVAERDGKIFLQQIKGVATEISVNGKVMRNVKPRGTKRPVCGNIYLLTADEADHLFLAENDSVVKYLQPTIAKQSEAQGTRAIGMGRAKVAEAPTDEDFNKAAVYTIGNLPKGDARKGALLTIDYRGDCARLYADGKLIGDNFYNGRPFQYGLWRLADPNCTSLELRVLPLQKDMPIYFPREADTKTTGEGVKDVRVEKLK